MALLAAIFQHSPESAAKVMRCPNMGRVHFRGHYLLNVEAQYLWV